MGRSSGNFAFVLLTLTVLVGASALQAQIYKWQDADGKWHFSDAPQAGAETLEVEDLNAMPAVEPREWQPVVKPVRGKKVTMYSTAWCGFCSQARRYFRAEGIPFRELDIEKSPRAAKVFKEQYGGGGVPLIIVGKKRMRGWSQSGFNKLYGP